MITILLAIDSVVFLIILSVMSIIFILLSAIDEPSPKASGVVLTIVTTLIVLFTDAGRIVLEKPITVALCIVAYFIAGCIFSIFMRWPLYLYGIRKQLVVAKEVILKQYKITSIQFVATTPNSDACKAWANEVYRIGNPSGLKIDYDGKLVPPQYSENKARLLIWAELWPWCAFWILVRKPIIWIFDELLNLQILKRICQRISNWMFKDFNN